MLSCAPVGCRVQVFPRVRSGCARGGNSCNRKRPMTSAASSAPPTNTARSRRPNGTNSRITSTSAEGWQAKSTASTSHALSCAPNAARPNAELNGQPSESLRSPSRSSAGGAEMMLPAQCPPNEFRLGVRICLAVVSILLSQCSFQNLVPSRQRLVPPQPVPERDLLRPPLAAGRDHV